MYVVFIQSTSLRSYHCCIQGNGLASRLLVLALGSMNIFTVPTAIQCFTAYDKWIYCKLLWLKRYMDCIYTAREWLTSGHSKRDNIS